MNTKPELKTSVVALFAGALLFLTGCVSGPSFSVSINSIASKEVSGKRKFFVLPGNAGVPAADLQFQEAKGLLANVLRSKGFSEVPFDQAEMVVFLSYGIGEPETSTSSYSIPVFGQTGGGTSTFNATTTAPGTSSTTRGTISQPVTYGITGYQTGTRTSTTFTRWFRANAVDLEAYNRNGEMRYLWDTRAASIGGTGDIRVVLPIMFAAAKGSIASDTGRVISTSLKEDDPRVFEVKWPTQK